MHESKINQMSHLIHALDVISLTVICETVIYPWNLRLLELMYFDITLSYHSDILTESIYVHVHVGADYQYLHITLHLHMN